MAMAVAALVQARAVEAASVEARSQGAALLSVCIERVAAQPREGLLSMWGCLAL